MLNMRSYQGLSITIWIVTYRLKLVNGNDTWFISSLNILEYLFKGSPRRMDVTYFNVP